MLVARRIRLSSGRATTTSLLIPRRGVSRLLWVSSFHRRGRSSAAHAPSEVPKAQEGRKAVSRDERKDLVESYICKYRSMNGGKFPTVSAAVREVGGSFYVVRQLLQEIEYEYKTSSSDMKNEKLIERRKPSIVSQAASSELTKDGKIKEQSKKIIIDDVLGDSTVQNVEFMETPKPTSSIGGVLCTKTLDTKTEDDTSRDFSNQSPMVYDGEVEGVSKKHLVKNKNKQRKEKKQFVNDSTVDDKTQKVVTSRENSNLSDAAKSIKETKSKKWEDLYRLSGKVEHVKEASFEDALDRGDLLKDTTEKDTAIKQNEEAPRVHTEKSSSSLSFWGSLKSLAAGVINIWSNKR